MRICLFTPELPPFQFGGIGAYTRQLAIEYARAGHEVEIAGVGIHPDKQLQHDWGKSVKLDLPYAARLSEQARQQSSRVLSRLPKLWKLGPTVGSGGFVRRLQHSAHAIRRFLNSRPSDYDIVEFPNYYGLGANLPSTKAKVVVRLSTPAILSSITDPRVTELEAATVARADLVIGNSYAIIDKCQQHYPNAIHRSVVIPHGVADFQFDGVDRQNDVVQFVIVGRAEPRKGTDILLKAMNDAFAKGIAARFTFVGADIARYVDSDPELQQLWRRLQSSPDDRLCVAGRVSDEEKDAAYAQAHWTLIPSRYESFGLTAIESLRVGTPVVASDVGGLSETVTRAPGSKLVPPESVAAWSDAMQRLATAGPEKSDALKADSRSAYEEHFTSERMAAASLQVYRELLDESREAPSCLRSVCSQSNTSH